MKIGSYKGVKYYVTFSKEKFDKVVAFSVEHWKIIAGVVMALLLLFMLAGCGFGKSDTVQPTAFNCQGTYVGSYSPPEHDERIRLRNKSLELRGIALVADEAVNNANAGGGSPDGGIWMGGSYQFTADADCKVTGTTNVFYAYPYEIVGTIASDRTFKLTWQGSGSAGRMDGKVELDGNISGTFHHPEPESYIYGVISGSFTAAAK